MGNADGWKQILPAVVGVFAASASLLLIASAVYQGPEKTQQSRRLRRAFFIFLAALYVVSMIIGIFRVIEGKQSPEVLLGLPGGLILIWLFWSAARKVRPPS